MDIRYKQPRKSIDILYFAKKYYVRYNEDRYKQEKLKRDYPFWVDHRVQEPRKPKNFNFDF